MLEATQRIRVEWAHCDPAGIIFNPHYYIWMDAGTHALLHTAGFELAEAVRNEEGFRGCPLVASNMAFRKPLYFNDVTVLRSQIESFGNTSFVVAHAFYNDTDEAPVASGQEVRVWGGSDPEFPERLKAVPVPKDVRALLSVEKTVDVSV
ncbi:MAG: thioesterase family protein [Pseudomonadota bacterium]